MSRHGAKQLPRTGHGDSLCKHLTPGSCTWWCSYGRFVKVSVAVFAVIAGFGSLSVFLDKVGGYARLVDAGIALAIYTVIVALLIIFANQRDGGDHY
ncbi:hypothetical protein [Actinophytocola sediminis]